MGGYEAETVAFGYHRVKIYSHVCGHGPGIEPGVVCL